MRNNPSDEAAWGAAIQALRQAGQARPILELLKANGDLGRKLLSELTTWATDDLPEAVVLQQIVNVVKRDAAVWLAETPERAAQHYQQVLLSAKLGLAHPHPLLRHCWSHALDLLLHEHLTRLPFPTLISAFLLTSMLDPRLKLRWLTALVGFVRRLYAYAAKSNDCMPLHALVPFGDELMRFAIGSLSDASSAVRARSAMLLRLLLPLSEAETAAESIPQLLSAMDRPQAGTSAGSVQSGAEASTRYKIEREIVATEETYVAGLEGLVRNVIDPLRARALIPDDQACAIFSNLPSIATLNRLLLSELQQCSCAIQCACIPGAFVRFAGTFKLYSEYVNGFDQCLQLLSGLRDNAPFNKFIASTNVQLTSILISPIQRIPRYLLLLQELSRHTPPDHTAFAVIQQAVDKIRLIADHLNESKKRVEDLTKLLALQNRITGRAPSLIKPDRELLLDGVVMKRSSSNKALSRRHSRHVYVFNDMILWCTPSHRYKGMLELTHTDSSRIYEARDEYLLDVVGSRRSIQLEFGNRRERDEWHSVVDDAIRALQDRHHSTLRTGTIRMKNLLERDLQRSVQSQTPVSTPVNSPKSSPVSRTVTDRDNHRDILSAQPNTEAMKTLHSLVLLYGKSLGSDTIDMISDEALKALNKIHRSLCKGKKDVTLRNPGFVVSLLAYCTDRLCQPWSSSSVSDDADEDYSGSSSSRDASPNPSNMEIRQRGNGRGPGETGEGGRLDTFCTQLFPIVLDIMESCPSPKQSAVFRQASRCITACIDRCGHGASLQ